MGAELGSHSSGRCERHTGRGGLSGARSLGRRIEAGTDFTLRTSRAVHAGSLREQPKQGLDGLLPSVIDRAFRGEP